MSNSLPESLFKAIGLKENDWNQFLKEAPHGQDPLYWAFKNNKVSESKYFALAKEIYPFAHLKAEIIHSDFWKEFKSNIKNPVLENGYIKFYSWDNVDYFFGTRPPAETLQKNTCFLFAPTSVLDDFYATPVTNKAEKVSEDPAVVIDEAPAQVVSSDTVTETEIPSAPEEAPEGIDLSAVELPDLPEDTASKESPEAILDAPEGFSDSQVANIDHTDSPEGFELSSSEPAAEEAPEGLSIDSVSEEENVLSFDQADSALNETQPQVEAPAEPPVVAKIEDAKPVTKPSGQSSEFASIQNQLNNVFKEAIIFTYANNEFTAVSHSDQLKPQGDTTIKTDTPSAFRIVSQSGRVYLGHMVKTEVNDAFVKTWFPNGAPEKVIIQPIMVSNQLTGAYLAVCGSATDNHSLIRKGEDLAKEMTSNWPQSYSSAA